MNCRRPTVSRFFRRPAVGPVVHNHPPNTLFVRCPNYDVVTIMRRSEPEISASICLTPLPRNACLAMPHSCGCWATAPDPCEPHHGCEKMENNRKGITVFFFMRVKLANHTRPPTVAESQHWERIRSSLNRGTDRPVTAAVRVRLFVQ